MELIGKIKDFVMNPITRKHSITFELEDGDIRDIITPYYSADRLAIKVSQYRQKRSLDANGLLWACLGEMAQVLRTDKWDVYLQELKRYGQYTYVVVNPCAVEQLKARWRESEEVGKINVNGREGVQMLMYYGSSTYNSKEFSVLLDGVISDMKDLGLQPPPSEDMRRALERLEKHEKYHTED